MWTGDGAPAPNLAPSIAVPSSAGLWRKLLAFGGPGYLVSVGYMDPGNWATDLAAGSGFGFRLLSVVALSSLTGLILQALSLRLGIVAGRDLAQACREVYPKRVAIVLWLLAEIAIVACDLAEVLGTAIALQVLFGLPLLIGVVLTALDVLVVLALQNRGMRVLEAIVIGMIGMIAASFAFELAMARPNVVALLDGFVPRADLLTNSSELVLAVGILGATVMPHNLYLQSALVQTRRFDRSIGGVREALRYARFDTFTALFLAFLVNAAILILAAATFHSAGHEQVRDIGQAHALLAPLLGAPAAALVFALALLLSGQNSTLTGTLAGQIVMEGFVALRVRPWLRRLITRSLAILPALAILTIVGEHAAGNLLIASQVVLSLQLPFAMVPLVAFTTDRRRMGDFAIVGWRKLGLWMVAAVVTAINLALLASLA